MDTDVDQPFSEHRGGKGDHSRTVDQDDLSHTAPSPSDNKPSPRWNKQLRSPGKSDTSDQEESGDTEDSDEPSSKEAGITKKGLEERTDGLADGGNISKSRPMEKVAERGTKKTSQSDMLARAMKQMEANLSRQIEAKLSRQNEVNLTNLTALSHQFEERLTQLMNHLSETRSRSSRSSPKTPFSSKRSSPRTPSTYSEARVESTQGYLDKMVDRTCATPKESVMQQSPITITPHKSKQTREYSTPMKKEPPTHQLTPVTEQAREEVSSCELSEEVSSCESCEKVSSHESSQQELQSGSETDLAERSVVAVSGGETSAESAPSRLATPGQHAELFVTIMDHTPHGVNRGKTQSGQPREVKYAPVPTSLREPPTYQHVSSTTTASGAAVLGKVGEPGACKRAGNDFPAATGSFITLPEPPNSVQELQSWDSSLKAAGMVPIKNKTSPVPSLKSQPGQNTKGQINEGLGLEELVVLSPADQRPTCGPSEEPRRNQRSLVEQDPPSVQHTMRKLPPPEPEVEIFPCRRKFLLKEQAREDCDQKTPNIHTHKEYWSGRQQKPTVLSDCSPGNCQQSTEHQVEKQPHSSPRIDARVITQPQVLQVADNYQQERRSDRAEQVILPQHPQIAQQRQWGPTPSRTSGKPSRTITAERTPDCSPRLQCAKVVTESQVLRCHSYGQLERTVSAEHVISSQYAPIVQQRQLQQTPAMIVNPPELITYARGPNQPSPYAVPEQAMDLHNLSPVGVHLMSQSPARLKQPRQGQQMPQSPVGSVPVSSGPGIHPVEHRQIAEYAPTLNTTVGNSCLSAYPLPPSAVTYQYPAYRYVEQPQQLYGAAPPGAPSLQTPAFSGGGHRMRLGPPLDPWPERQPLKSPRRVTDDCHSQQQCSPPIPLVRSTALPSHAPSPSGIHWSDYHLPKVKEGRMSGQDRSHPRPVHHLCESKEDLDSGLSSEPGSPPRAMGPKTPRFHGHVGEWENFEYQFNAVAGMYRWTEDEKFGQLLVSLKDEAVTYVRTLPPGVDNNYQDLMSELRQRFQGAERPEAIRRQLPDVKQRVDETFEQFADRIRGLVAIAYREFGPAATGMMDAMAKETFLRGLRDRDLAISAATFRGPFPNIQAALEAVKDADAIQKCFGRTPSLGRHVTFLEETVEAGQSYSRRHPRSGSTSSRPTMVSIAIQATGHKPLDKQIVAKPTENVPPDKTPRSCLMSSPRCKKPDRDRCFGRNQWSHFRPSCPLPESPKGNGRQ